MNFQSAISIRLPYHHTKAPFVVAWSQKAGCTSILKWFLFHAGLLEEAEAYVSGLANIDIHVYEQSILKSEPGYKRELVKKLAGGIPVFNFIRCPYQRAFSSYLHLNNRGFIAQERNGKSPPGLTVRKSILRAVYGDNVSIEYPLSFLDYLRWLNMQEVGSLEVHHAPQSSEIYKYENIHHYRLEDFSNAARVVEDRFGLSSSQPVADKFTGNHHKKKSEVSLGATLTLLETGMPVNPSPTFIFPRVTRETLKDTEFAVLIEQVFHNDIQLYDSLTPA
jgi:hypothetical protein